MEAILQVADFLRLTNEVLRLNILPNSFAIEGEITGFQVKDGKWLIFSLKDERDEKVKLKCFATVFKISGVFEDGMRVQVWGSPNVKAWSEFQMDVQKMEPVGEGAIKRNYELLKQKLEQEGLFSPMRKRSIPKFPERIGLITSKDAAAYGDFLRILNNRWGGVKVVHANVHVQGKDAVPEILEALATFAALAEGDRPEVLVLTRGGGSLEDLHAFNDERVVRAIYASPIPVVCGVGHERDESLCDFVADVRASTPSNAAERVVPDRSEIRYSIEQMEARAEETLHRTVERCRASLVGAERVLFHFFERQTMRVDGVIQRLLMQTSSWMLSVRSRVESEERLLRNVDPTRILHRGYALVRRGTKVITAGSELAVGEGIEVTFADGTREAQITN